MKKIPGVFPAQFYNFPGAFCHSLQRNIKRIWSAIVTKQFKCQ